MVDIVTLPPSPAPRSATVKLLSFTTDAQGPLGGPVQRVLRPGSRFQVDYTYPPMPAPMAQALISRLIRAEATPVAIPFPMRGYARLTAPGLVAAGSTSSGGVLPVRGGPAGLSLPEGQPFHISSGGRRWVHLLQDAVVLDGSGAANLTLNPLLRVQVADGDALEFTTPVIEGFVSKDGLGWDVELASLNGVKFTVAEDR